MKKILAGPWSSKSPHIHKAGVPSIAFCIVLMLECILIVFGKQIVNKRSENVSEFDVNTLFGCVSQCLQLITGDKELPTRLPPNISTRFKVCGELAQLCQVIAFCFDKRFGLFCF